MKSQYESSSNTKQSRKISVAIIVLSVTLLIVIAAMLFLISSKKCPDCHGEKLVLCTSCIGGVQECFSCTDGKTACAACSCAGTLPCTLCSDDGHTICKTCDGEGCIKSGGTETCFCCGGDGKEKINPYATVCLFCHGKGYVYNWESCPNCEGGKLNTLCYYCNGTKQAKCLECYGAGELICSVCQGTEHITCLTCYGGGKVECTKCS